MYIFKITDLDLNSVKNIEHEKLFSKCSLLLARDDFKVVPEHVPREM